MRIIRFDNKGWRARFDDGFDEQNVARAADAFAYIWADAYPGSTIYVGYDTRFNGRRLAGIAAGTLAGYGLRAVVSSDPCPTPALGWSVARDPHAAGGVMLTASGSSCEYGGITARGADGGPIGSEFYKASTQIVSSLPVSDAGSFSYEDIVGPYLEHVRSLVDPDVIAKADVNVVVDPLYGSGRGYLAKLLRMCGCRVHEIHEDAQPDFGGLHPVPSEPWVDTCEQAVTAYGCDMGLVLDGDADRFAVIDENGKFVTPHRTAPLLMGHLVKNRGLQGRVVATFSSSAALRRQASRLGCDFTAVPMGFERIYREFVEGDVVMGADELGGVAFPAHLAERDGLLAALLIVELRAASGSSVSEQVSELEAAVGSMSYIRKDIRLDVASVQAFRNVLPGLNLEKVCGMRPVLVGHADGLVLRFANDSWVQLRPSRTESLVRACAEAPTPLEADRLAEEACAQALSWLPS